MLHTIHYGNNIIDLYYNSDLDIIINDTPLKGTPIFDSNLYELYKRDRGNNISFTGGNSQTYGNRFFVDKAWANTNMNGTELIPLSGRRKSKLKINKVEGTEIPYSNYTEEPVIFENKILKYLNIDKYSTFEVDEYTSPILMGSNKYIDATYPYKPSLIKFLILGRGQI